MTVIAPPRLQASTVEVADRVGAEVSLLDLVPADVDPVTVCAWLREGDGLVAWGRVAAQLTHGVGRFESAERWWSEVADRAEVVDEVSAPGTGLLAFGSFAFSAASTEASRLVVPEVVMGRRDGRTWMTTIVEVGAPAPDPGPPRAQSVPGAWPITEIAGSVSSADWPRVIASAVERIESGDLDKVVLARDVVAESTGPIDVHRVLRRLAARYAATWTFAVDGLVGATPEMLVRLVEGTVRSRVLAGTVRRDRGPTPLVTETHPDLDTSHRGDPRLRLISSDKDLEEHAYAVRSVAEALARHCRELEVPAEPFVLELPDVYHLASDLTGVAVDGATALRLAAALHPSAAVCGTPAQAAADVIAELEGMDRGRYAGPVGWVDATGEGDWGIALRCGKLCEDGRQMRLFAGGGIVAASDPDAELAETEVKLAAMRYALDC
ncbi:MAG: isochorismate synthase [Ornithinimicrobium sp.]|uniref:isochorismate synthase n=1 Tax=Ornithinimicrobium sp. TaxID=1977084 RepID=UPI003D9BBC55